MLIQNYLNRWIARITIAHMYHTARKEYAHLRESLPCDLCDADTSIQDACDHAEFAGGAPAEYFYRHCFFTPSLNVRKEL